MMRNLLIYLLLSEFYLLNSAFSMLSYSYSIVNNFLMLSVLISLTVSQLYSQIRQMWKHFGTFYDITA